MQTQPNDPNDNPYESPHSRVISSNGSTVEYRGKVYSLFAIAIGTLLGSVLAAGWLIHSNFTHFKQTWQANLTLLFTVIASIALLFSSLIIEKLSALLYLSLNFVLIICLIPVIYLFQGDSLAKHEDENLPFHSSIRAALVGLVCLLAMGIMLTFAYTMFIVATR